MELKVKNVVESKVFGLRRGGDTMRWKILVILLFILLAVSVFFNVKHDRDNVWFVSFTDANTRPTYDAFHHIKEAHHLSTGKGIKIGVIGKYFGYTLHKDLYAGGKDFSVNTEAFEVIAEHGLWMATTLKEIAPNAEIYALCARDSDRSKEAAGIAEAIDWAIENNINILTYSGEQFCPEDRPVVDKAVRKAIEHNIVTTFIHYDLDENILPCGLFPTCPDTYYREPDVNVFHFDYNTMLLSTYQNFIKSGRETSAHIGATPYFSNSSMSPVLAGIVAMMKEINNDLSPAEYKKILVETSKEMEYNGYKVSRVVDAAGAMNYLHERGNFNK